MRRHAAAAPAGGRRGNAETRRPAIMSVNGTVAVHSRASYNNTPLLPTYSITDNSCLSFVIVSLSHLFVQDVGVFLRLRYLARCALGYDACPATPGIRNTCRISLPDVPTLAAERLLRNTRRHFVSFWAIGVRNSVKAVLFRIQGEHAWSPFFVGFVGIQSGVWIICIVCILFQ